MTSLLIDRIVKRSKPERSALHLKKRAEKLIKQGDDHAIWVLRDACDYALIALENFNWISVLDRLPDPYVRVLVLENDQGEIIPNVAWHRPDYAPNIWHSCADIIEDYITHWQPLPPVPKTRGKT